MNTAAKSAGEAVPQNDGRPASQDGRPPGRRPAWQRVLLVPGVVLAVFLVVRALVELATIQYNLPASYAKDWGGPSLAGVLAVHAGPGIAVALGTVWWVLRRGPARP
jgi:hypothetical protein